MSEEITQVIMDAVADAGDVGVDTSAADTAADTAVTTTDVSTGGDATSSDEHTDTSADTGKVEAAKVEQVVEDAFAKEHGLVTKRPDGRENRIPYSRVKAIAEGRERKVIASIAKELGITKAEAELKMEDVTGALTERGTKMKGHEDRLAQIDAIESVMAGDPDKFMQWLVDANPGYKKFVEGGGQKQTQQQQTAVDDANDPEPMPDMPLTDDPNGPRTYSLAQLDKARAWDRRQAKRDAMKEFDTRFKPIEDERKAAENAKAQAAQREQVQKDADTAVQRDLAEAATWPGFVENSKAILEVYKADKNISVHGAYMKFMAPKFATDRSTMRQEIIDELKGAPRDTSTQAKKPAPAATPGRETFDDIIRAEIAKLKR